VQWTPPAERVLILRSTAGISDAPAAGVSYSIGNSIGSSIVVYMGTASSFTDTGAGEGVKYYCAFASDLALNCAAAGSQLNTVGYNGIVYVKILSGSDANLGISTSPMASIQAGVDLAYSLGIPAVRVAQGSYLKSGPVVTLKEGVSLYGGYSDADWNTRAPLTYITTIKDTKISGVGTTFTSPNHAVQAGTGITSGTVVDGFTIAGAAIPSDNDMYQAALFITGAPTIQNNVLDAGSGPSLVRSMAVVVSESSPVIQNNTIVTGFSGTNHAYPVSTGNPDFAGFRCACFRARPRVVECRQCGQQDGHSKPFGHRIRSMWRAQAVSLGKSCWNSSRVWGKSSMRRSCRRGPTCVKRIGMEPTMPIRLVAKQRNRDAARLKRSGTAHLDSCTSGRRTHTATAGAPSTPRTPSHRGKTRWNSGRLVGKPRGFLPPCQHTNSP